MRRRPAGVGWKWTLLAGASIVTLMGAGPAVARNFGIDSGQMPDGPVTCSNTFGGLPVCHGVATDAVSVTISGLQQLAENQTALYTIEISENVPGALQVGAGLNVVAILDEVLTALEDGILGADAPNLQITEVAALFVAEGQLTHVAATFADPNFNSIGVFSYEFMVTAPSEPGILELRGAMNAFNMDFLSTGDNWNNTSLFITVPEPGASGLAAGLLTLTALAAARARRRAC